MALVAHAHAPRPAQPRPGHDRLQAEVADRALHCTLLVLLPYSRFAADAVNLATLQPHYENLTGTRGAFKTYSTTKAKVAGWEPKVAERQ